MKKLFLSLILCAGMASAQTQWSMMDFYTSDSMPYSSLTGLWTGVTHLACGDIHVQSTGTLYYVNGITQTALSNCVAAAHSNGAKALLILSDLNGYSSDDLKTAFNTNQTTLLNNISSLITTVGFDGILVDWEKTFPYGPGGCTACSAVQAALGTFFSALRTKLGSGQLISATAFSAGGSYGVATHIEWNTAITSLDRLIIMTYDMVYQVSGTYSWFNAPLYNGTTPNSTASSVDQNMQLFLGTLGGGGSTVPANKLMLGLPFYGYTYAGFSAPRQSAGGSIGGQHNYSYYAANYTLSGATYDTSAQVPWLAISGGGYITFDNAQSTQAKVNYAQTQGLGGWMAFNLFADYISSGSGPATYHPLLYAVTQAMGTVPTITACNPMWSAIQGSLYTVNLGYVSAAPVTWALATGTLPPGMSLSSAGLLSGTPTTAGTYSFTLSATNTVGSATQPFTLVVNPPASVCSH